MHKICRKIGRIADLGIPTSATSHQTLFLCQELMPPNQHCPRHGALGLANGPMTLEQRDIKRYSTWSQVPDRKRSSNFGACIGSCILFFSFLFRIICTLVLLWCLVTSSHKAGQPPSSGFIPASVTLRFAAGRLTPDFSLPTCLH